MKIGIDIRSLLDKRNSGVPEYGLRLLKAMFEIDRDNEYILFYNSWRDLKNRVPDWRFDNVKIIKTNYPNKFFSYILQKIFKWPKLDRLLQVDVFFMPHINFFALSDQVEKIITIHDLSFVFYPDFFSKRKNIWHRALSLQKNLLKFDKIIAVSENTKQDLIEYIGVQPEKIKVIRSGISAEFKKIASHEPTLRTVKEKYTLPDNFILYLGTIEPRKNIDGLIKAYELLLSNNPHLENVELVLAGAYGWKYKKILKIWQRSSYRPKIKFIGYVKAVEKVYLYNLAKLFVYPSFYEGFGFPPLEAMASGTPVVFGANSALAEISADAGVLINPYNINSITQAMREVLDDQALRQQLIQAGQQTAQDYDWAKTARETIKLCSQSVV